MPVQLDKILEAIVHEKVIHPNYPGASLQEQEEAWARVAKQNQIKVIEAQSLYKLLQKKYLQESQKEKSQWKLLSVMAKIYQTAYATKDDIKPKKPDDSPLPEDEEDEQYETMEVHEDEEEEEANTPISNAGGGQQMGSDGESPTKSSSKSEESSAASSPDKPPEKSTPQKEEKKLLNSGVNLSNSNRNSNNSAAAALQKKAGITIKRTSMGAGGGPGHTSGIPTRASTGGGGGGGDGLNVGGASNLKNHAKGNQTPILGIAFKRSSGGGGKALQLPEAIKRKLNEDTQHIMKKAQLSKSSPPKPTQQQNVINSHKQRAGQEQDHNTSAAQLIKVKQEQQDEDEVAANAHLNVITIQGAGPGRSSGNNNMEVINGLANIGASFGVGGPSSSTAATIASTSINGYSPTPMGMAEEDFKDGIILDGTVKFNNGPAKSANNDTAGVPSPGSIINLGNFDNSLPPLFFKNLCNSKRHEALGLYVANIMNRLSARSAAKLEVAILRAIIDTQSDELEN